MDNTAWGKVGHTLQQFSMLYFEILTSLNDSTLFLYDLLPNLFFRIYISTS